MIVKFVPNHKKQEFLSKKERMELVLKILAFEITKYKNIQWFEEDNNTLMPFEEVEILISEKIENLENEDFEKLCERLENIIYDTI